MDSTQEGKLVQRLRTIVDQLFVELFELPKETLGPEKHLFADLGLDSLDAIDLVIHLERTLKVTPPDEELQRIRKLEDVYTMVEKYYLLRHPDGRMPDELGVMVG
jgi:acyl carrier protein